MDTNVFVYLQSTSDGGKRGIAQRVIDELDCCVSTQVLNEVSNVLARKAGFSYVQIGEVVDGIVQTCEVTTVDYGTIRRAHGIAQRYQLGYYDSLIISSALEAGCKTLLTEDLTDGQIIGRELTILNIFDHPKFFDR
ncbi:MAG: PIN domain-containing protein [Eggerthellaceae bacterium]|nr:PIN domain-containing protein [Eggerthellaceae bacterium]